MLESGEVVIERVTELVTLVTKPYTTVTKSNIRNVIESEAKILEHKGEAMEELPGTMWYISGLRHYQLMQPQRIHQRDPLTFQLLIDSRILNVV